VPLFTKAAIAPALAEASARQAMAAFVVIFEVLSHYSMADLVYFAGGVTPRSSTSNMRMELAGIGP